MFHLLLAADPSVPNDIGGKYVAGAYVVFIVLLLIYVAIMAMKLARIEKGLGEVAEIAEARRGEGAGPAEAAQATEEPKPATTHTVTPGPAASGATAQETRP
jgi:hypothetical protein